MENNIPQQFEGKAFDYAKSVDFSSTFEAHQFYLNTKEKLLDVNYWHLITKIPSAKFNIVDVSNRIQYRHVQKGDHIRIDIPGPGLPSADGYDWVQVEEVLLEDNGSEAQILIRLRPSPDPTQDNDDTAHFFTQLATSSIKIQLEHSRVFIQYAGRNEVINTENKSLLDNFRNFMVGIGAKMGASFPQWKALIDGLINSKSPE